MVETGRIVETLDASWSIIHAELIGNLSVITEWADNVVLPDVIWFPDSTDSYRPLDSPANFIWWYAEEPQTMIRHGFMDRLDPYIVDNVELILSLHSQWEVELIGMNGPDDRRGPSYGNMARNILNNIRMTLEGSSTNKMYIYAMHSIPMTQLRDVLDIGANVINLGNAILLELRRDEEGEIYLKAEVLYPNVDGTEYISRPQPLRCPHFQDQCSLVDFFSFINRRAPEPGPDEGCCFRGQTFFEVGCGDFLNEATVAIPECNLWRRQCPATACGENQSLTVLRFYVFLLLSEKLLDRFCGRDVVELTD
eukprot:TRINITY_DN13751_c0_g1_i1.p1 TRINITY_DN13751_c0_g1~~TRINITY_DN13751_c0_g1_i1.p1  ORF type:complete len:309 (+),score=71.63 TRINITY_DN13751_c0_g1_i1:282-1208(+)